MNWKKSCPGGKLGSLEEFLVQNKLTKLADLKEQFKKNSSNYNPDMKTLHKKPVSKSE